MPSVVSDFIKNHNFSDVLKIQRNILEDYKMDIGKYAKETEKGKIRECFFQYRNIYSKIIKNLDTV